VSLFAGSIPCSLLALFVTALYESWSHNRFVEVGLRGALASAIGAMVATGWTLIRPFWKGLSPVRLAVFAGGASALALYGLTPIRVLFWPRLSVFFGRKGKRDEHVRSLPLSLEGDADDV
jgi:chromate transport protein ChrA